MCTKSGVLREVCTLSLVTLCTRLGVFGEFVHSRSLLCVQSPVFSGSLYTLGRDIVYKVRCFRVVCTLPAMNLCTRSGVFGKFVHSRSLLCVQSPVFSGSLYTPVRDFVYQPDAYFRFLYPESRGHELPGKKMRKKLRAAVRAKMCKKLRAAVRANYAYGCTLTVLK